MTDKPVLFILCGLPYSGKSYIAKDIERITGASLISYDVLRKKRNLQTDSPDPNDLNEWREIINVAISLIKIRLSSGKSVIFDHVNPQESDRTLLIDLAKDIGAYSAIIFVNTPTDTIRKRRKQNTASKTRHHIESANMDKIRQLWQAPVIGKNIYTYAPGQDIDQLIKRIFSGISLER